MRTTYIWTNTAGSEAHITGKKEKKILKNPEEKESAIYGGWKRNAEEELRKGKRCSVVVFFRHSFAFNWMSVSRTLFTPILK